jgi:hypothetical protein
LAHTVSAKVLPPLQNHRKVYFSYLEVYFSYFLIGVDYKKIAAVYFEIEKIDKKVQKIYLEIGAACFLPVREDFPTAAGS